MTDSSQDLRETLTFISDRTAQRPEIALVLGSGLGDFAEALDDRFSLRAREIPHYPHSTVEGHKGELVFGGVGGKAVLALQGRVHLYETGSIRTVCYPIDVARGLGAQLLIVTNAVGAINRTFIAGDNMLITDQINFSGKTIESQGNPARGARLLYDRKLAERGSEVAANLGLSVRKGVYAGVLGPSYETAAEVEMLNRAGADVVGMSTVLEVERANSLNMSVLGISCITNLATGIALQKLSHNEVTLVANKVKKDFALLLKAIITSL